MYLKSIEMQGFKSFANKTVLEFHNGVTGIVGPNGSGKSNVADAVRWVLGEQSAKQLRGGNMQDVIFSGTENRKPLGFASVAITLDNADRKLNFDADEITVTRKLYRSGESEYLLNGRACRLRDINELFYDTGIGKEGYSIIGQGQIDKILSGKPEDRRELFDEAAGIVKFKRRKAASLKKLEDEQSNLVRVNDILAEVTGRIGPLEAQSKKAETYLAKRDALRTMEIQLFQIEEGREKKEAASLEEKKKIASDQLASVEADLAKSREAYDKAEAELQTLDGQIGNASEEIRKIQIDRQQRQGQIDVLKEQIRAAETNSRILQDRLDAIEKEKTGRAESLSRGQEEQDALNARLAKLREDQEQKAQAAAALTESVRQETARAEQGRNDTIDILNRRSDIKERMQRYDTMLEQIGIRKSELDARMLSMRQEAEGEKEKLAGLEAELKKTADAVAEKNESVGKAQAQLAFFKDTLTQNNQKLETDQNAYHRESSRLESLRSVTERYEGYGNSVKKVMELKDSNPGIQGVVADLIRTDKKYETAIETALGGAVQNIVTDNEATAKYLIEYLKKGHYGRATFLPLTAMRSAGEFNSPEVLREPGVVGLASGLVRYDKRYEGVVRRLLGKTVVVDTIDHAIAVSRRHHQSVRMVTFEGELLSPGGSMTGGSFRYSSNLLGRRRQIKELDENVRALKADIEKTQKEIDAIRTSRNEVRESLARDQEELQKLSLALNTAKLNYTNGKTRADSLKSEYDKLAKEQSEIQDQVAEITEKRALISGQLDDSEREQKELEEKVRSITGGIEAERAKEQAAKEAADAAKLAFANAEQQASFAKEKLATAEAEIRRLEAEKDTVARQIEEESGNSGKKEALIQDLETAIADLAQKEMQEQETSRQLQEQKEKLNQEHHTFFEKRDALSAQKADLDQEIFRLDARAEKLQEERENLISELYEEYQLTPDQAEQVTFEELPDRGPLKKSITAAKSEIRALGNINVNAIEEYKEVRERHDFLQTQHDDLVKAADELNEIIRQLDESMRKQFRERFGAIQEEFDRVFRQLFGGGKGTLELVEGEDVLESGIMINAQPPGKKLQNMMQLSGGEKALTAISLLFAIQNLKPSPFCLLDEIEAALDDSNVGRFAGYLHKLTKHTQFIVITHRRGTMAAADRLYGITMQEKGVSTLISVDLIENQLDA